MSFKFNTNSISPVSGGGSGGDVVWGNIGGNLSNQTDLNTALNAKQDLLTAGNNITITNNVISATGGGGSGTATSVENKNTSTGATNPLIFWEGTSEEYENGGGSQTWYNWQGGAIIGWGNVITSFENNFNAVAYGNGKFIAVGDSSYRNDWLINSTDGSTWSGINTGLNPVGLYDIIYVNNKFITIGNNLTIMSSSDGSTWIQEIPSSNYFTYRSITYGNNKYIIVGDSGGISSSSDGSTWSDETSGVSYGLKSVTYGNGKFITVGLTSLSTPCILKSSNGSTWIEIILPGISGSLYSVVYGNNKFVAVGTNGLVLTSSDGDTWTKETTNLSANFEKVIYADNKYVAIGNDYTITYGAQVIYSSTDGSTWTQEYADTEHSNALFGITYGDNKFIVVGSNGRIMNSSLETFPSCFTTDSAPTTSSQVYSAPNTASALTITSVGTGTITLSDTNTYNYNASGNQTTTQSVGEAHPDWICMIEGAGIRKGNTTIAS